MSTFFCTALQGKGKGNSWTKVIYKIVFVFLGETTCWHKASRHLELLLPNLPSQCLRSSDAMLSLSGVIFCIGVLYFVELFYEAFFDNFFLLRIPFPLMEHSPCT